MDRGAWQAIVSLAVYRTLEKQTLYFQSSIIIVAEVHLAIIIRTTRVSPATSLALVREMSLRSAQVSAQGILSGWHHDTIKRLRLTQNNFI